MVTINISDELYAQITKTLNDTRNAKNSMTHELESQQLDLDTAISELKHPSAVVELMKASSNAQANIELINKILRQVSIVNAFTPKKLSREAIDEAMKKIEALGGKKGGLNASWIISDIGVDGVGGDNNE